MRTNIEELIKNTPRGDVQLHGFVWTEGGRDFVLSIRLPGNEPDRDRSLVCRWAHGLVVNLTFDVGRGGYPLTWDTKLSREADGTWAIHLDFAEAGDLKLKCNDVELISRP